MEEQKSSWYADDWVDFEYDDSEVEEEEEEVKAQEEVFRVSTRRRKVTSQGQTPPIYPRERKKDPPPQATSVNLWAALETHENSLAPSSLEDERSLEGKTEATSSSRGKSTTTTNGAGGRQRKVKKKVVVKQAPPRKSEGSSTLVVIAAFVVAFAIWVPPTFLWLVERPHPLSRQGAFVVDSFDASLVFLSPRPETVVQNAKIDCELGGKLLREGAASKAQVDVYLDHRMILGGDHGKVNLPNAPPDNATSDKPRLTWDMGSLNLGLHNLTIAITSLENPPRFPSLKNTSLFSSDRIISNNNNNHYHHHHHRSNDDN